MLPRALGAILVLLVGAAIFLTVGRAGSDRTASSGRDTSSSERKAVRLEGRLARSPDDEELLLATMQAWIAAGNARLVILGTRTRPIPIAIPEDYMAGLRLWNRYLGQTGGEAGPDVAELAGDTFFKLLEIGTRVPSEAEANAAGAARALRIADRHRRTLVSLSNLATDEYFNGEFAAGDRAARGAVGTVDRASAGGVMEQLDEYRERAERFLRQVKRGVGKLRESGKEKLAAPILSHGSSAGINGPEQPE